MKHDTESRDAARSPTLAVLSAGVRTVYDHLATLRLIQRDRAMLFVTFAAALEACEPPKRDPMPSSHRAASRGTVRSVPRSPSIGLANGAHEAG